MFTVMSRRFLFCLSDILLSDMAAGFVPFPVHKLNFSILY